MNRGINRRGKNRRTPLPTTRFSRLPKNLTANVPFLVGRNKQVLSVPSHTDGLTIQRAVRFNINVAAPGDFTIPYGDVFTRFRGELNITTTANGRLSFTPGWVSVYVVSAGTTFSSIAVRIFDEPRSNTTVNAFVNTPYFEAVDTSTMSGFCCVKAVIPKAATYSIGTDDPTNMLLLPFIGYGVQNPCQLIVDVGGSWTIKSISGATFANPRNIPPPTLPSKGRFC